MADTALRKDTRLKNKKKKKETEAAEIGEHDCL